MRYRLARTPQDMRDIPRDQSPGRRHRRLVSVVRALVTAAACLTIGPDPLGQSGRSTGSAALDTLRQQFLQAARRQPDHDAVVVVRARSDRRGDCARPSSDEARRPRRRRDPAGLSAGARRRLERRRQHVPFLSEPFLERLRFAADDRPTLGLRLDLTLGSGWPYGGPTVGIADAASQLRLERIAVRPGRHAWRVPAMTPARPGLPAFVGPEGDTPSRRARCAAITSVPTGRAASAADALRTARSGLHREPHRDAGEASRPSAAKATS